jgi:phosphoribosyl 1,2-cyclic phosphodiesterase
MEPVSNLLKDFSRVIAAERAITFLGTGPSNPITERSGKSNRRNTSTLLTYKGKKYLIDVPPKTDPNLKPDYLLVTHLHEDAFGGFNKISKQEFVFGMPPAIEKKLKDKKGPWKKEKLKVDRSNDFGDLRITPFEVVHDIIYKFATFGYQIIFKDDFILIYSSDMVAIPDKSEQYFEKVDLLITDGAGWNASLATHFGMWPFLELAKEKNWEIKKIYFTQIGRPVPDHHEAQKEISKINNKAKLAYDGLRIIF